MLDISNMAHEAKTSSDVSTKDSSRDDQEKPVQDAPSDGASIHFTPLGQTEAGKKMIARFTGAKKTQQEPEKQAPVAPDEVSS